MTPPYEMTDKFRGTFEQRVLFVVNEADVIVIAQS